MPHVVVFVTMKLKLLHIETLLLLCALCATNLLKSRAFGNNFINTMNEIRCATGVDLFNQQLDTKVFVWGYFGTFLAIYILPFTSKNFTNSTKWHILMYKLAQWAVVFLMFLVLTIATTNTCSHTLVLVHICCSMPMVYVEFLL